jgi:hypothetical protein
MYHNEKFEFFNDKAEAIVEHHFNNHSHYWDTWCTMRTTNATTFNLASTKKQSFPGEMAVSTR